MEIEVEQADLLSMVGKGEGKVHRDGGFPYPSFPAQDEDDVSDINFCFRRQTCWGTVRLRGSAGVAVLIAGCFL